MEGANWRVILDGLRDGDPESWVEFDAHFHRQMLSAMARQFPRLQSSEAARDVVSTALQKIVRQIRNGNTIDPVRLPGYVLTTCIREAIKEFCYRTRLLSLETCLPDCQLIYSDISAEDYIIRKEQVALLKRAMRRLLPSERQLLIGFYFRGESLKQLAAQRGASLGSIQVRKKRVLMRLGKVFEELTR
jgi:RNA polymerase sigma factor (sigma-70 family)